jgi:hypothetical protein
MHERCFLLRGSETPYFTCYKRVMYDINRCGNLYEFFLNIILVSNFLAVYEGGDMFPQQLHSAALSKSRYFFQSNWEPE